ncbi:MAG TPA: hypothetical protein VKE51_42630 [Vicinamibacterales bacterium]|nr:hypothetical protein [Vicinamibacterales bacterium]
MRLTAAVLVAATAALAGLARVAGAPLLDWEPQMSGVTARLRGVSAVSDRVAWASGADGTVLRTVDGGRTWQQLRVPGAERLDFRDVDATSDRAAYVLSIGAGEASRIYKTVDAGRHWDLQFANTDPHVFLDAMTFRDDTHGIAFSDSVDGRFVILTTVDGRTWERIPADRLPPARSGEGAFAASGTNVAMAAGRIWIGTTAGRVLRSTDEGRTWTVAETGLATGDSAGIFSVAFRDAGHGVVVGGDYRKELAAIDNVAWTSDGGTTWSLATDHGLSGFRSVVGFVAAAPSKTALIAIGPAGADWSNDDGRTWTAVASAGFDTFCVTRSGRIGWAAGTDGRISRWSVR